MTEKELLPAKIRSRQLGQEKVPREVVSTPLVRRAGFKHSGPSDDDKEPSTQFKISDDRPDEPRITEEAFFRCNILFYGDIEMGILHEPLKEYGILDETSFHVLRSVRECRMGLFYLDQMHYLMYILGKRENGLQILYRCLKKTQHRFPEHWRIVHYLERNAYRMKGSTSSSSGHGITRKEMPHIDVSLPIHSDATTTSKSTLTISDRRDDEPQITEEVFFYKMLPLDVEVLVPELKEHGILLDESIVSSVDMPMGGIDELHYVMYRLGKKENGLQIFYRCLRETQDECPDHRRVADMIEREARSIASRRKSAKADPAETGTSSSKIPLAVPSSPVESQQSSASQGAQLPSPSSTTEPEETVVYTGEACSHVSQNGISFHFPASESKCRVELRFKVVNDDYVLPKGYEDMPLVSSMFEITTSDELPVPVTVRMEHCAIIEEDDSLVHMIAHGPPPYHFQPLLSGTFPLGERYGEIQVKRFSIFTILAKILGLRLSLSVQVFYHDHSSATFVATKNLQRLISAVKSMYAGAKKGLEQSVLCGYETKAIALTIPNPPQEGGWHVKSACDPPMIETRLIREYREGKTPPCVHLKMKWTGEGMPVEEDIRIAVGGTTSIDSFLLSCKPALTTHVMPTSTPSTPTSQSQPPSLQSDPAQPTSSFPPSAPVSQPTLDVPVPPRSPVQSGTKSVELKALKRSSDVFCSGVDPNTLATKLMAEELFTSEEHESATQRTATNHQRNNEILTALVRRVSADSSVFHTVVRLLQQEPALKAVGDRMQEIFEEERAGQ